MSAPGRARAYRLGLTGSIGMGKSTTAAMFRAAGVPVWDADAAVHGLYAPGGAAVAAVLARWPAARSVTGGVTGAAAGVDRARLRAALGGRAGELAALERIVHPLVAADRAAFLASAPGDLVLLDIPLLYEGGAERELDAVLVVTAPPALQAARLRARPDYDPATVAALLARQMPDREKRARADHIIETLSPASARAAVGALIAWIRGPLCPRPQDRPERPDRLAGAGAGAGRAGADRGPDSGSARESGGAPEGGPEGAPDKAPDEAPENGPGQGRDRS